MKTIKLPDLNKDNHVPLYIQLGEILIKYIQKNRLTDGDLIPSENDLLARYEVSRMTIRQAVQWLESQEIVKRVRGKGTFVTAPKRREHIRNFQHFEDRLRELGRKPENILLDYQKTLLPQKWIKSYHLWSDGQALLIRKLKLADGEPLAIDERYLPLDVASRFIEKDLRDHIIFDLLRSQTDLSMARVLYTYNSSLITQSEAREFKVNHSGSVLRRLGVYYNSKEQLVMFSRVAFLGDKIELSLEYHNKDDNWGTITIV
jgi:GntR family transcriptional regulator